MNGLTVRLRLSIMISPFLSLHPFQKQWTKHWCIYFVYQIYYTCMIMCTIFTWVHTGQPILNVVFQCLFWQQHKTKVWECSNSPRNPKDQPVSQYWNLVDKSQQKTFQQQYFFQGQSILISLVLLELDGIGELHVPRVRYNMSCTGTHEKVSSLVVWE